MYMQPLPARKTKTVKLTGHIPQSQVRHIYGIPKGGYGTRRGMSCITDQITDHFAPYCSEPSNGAINEIRVLDES